MHLPEYISTRPGRLALNPAALARLTRKASPDQLAEIRACVEVIEADQHSRYTPEREQADLWREQGDPELVLREMFGVLPLTSDQRVMVSTWMDNKLSVGVGANGTGKSYILVALTLAWQWHVLGYKPDAAGIPQGCLLAIVAPTGSAILQCWRSYFLKFGRLAAARGHPLAGWDKRSEDSITWVASAETWRMVGVTAPRQVGQDEVAHSVLGPHHPNFSVYLDELAGVKPKMIGAFKGRLVSSGAKATASTNPTSASSLAKRLIDNDGWVAAYSSAFRHPDILRRGDPLYPGSCSVPDVEDALRTAGLFRRVGQLWTREGDPHEGFARPETHHKDVVYALPDRGAVDKPGPREDGHPGHPEAVLSVFRPASAAAFGLYIGDFPHDRRANSFRSGRSQRGTATLARARRPSALRGG